MPFLPLVAIALVIMGLYVTIVVLVRRNKDKKLLLLGIESIDRLTGRDFERLLSQLFREQGAKVVLTPKCNDGGADIVIEQDGVRTVIQAKRWKGNVGVKAVQEVVASKAVYRAERAMVVTNSQFTKAAISLAQANRVQLWDRDRLQKKLLSLNPRDE